MIVVSGKGSSIITQGYNFIAEFFNNRKRIKTVNIDLKLGRIDFSMNKNVKCYITLKTTTNNMKVSLTQG